MTPKNVLEASVKGLIGSGIAVVLTLLFHQTVAPINSVELALIAVVAGSWFSGFFSSMTGNIICRDETEEDKQKQYMSVGTVLIVTGIMLYDNPISIAAVIIGGLLFMLAAYRASEKELSDYIS
ncbi:hypothetical protein GLT92_00165 [Nanohaloarchaea archaeon]|nr:hypothetical protein [Candidatus Nanohaloarchaea archaeon]